MPYPPRARAIAPRPRDAVPAALPRLGFAGGAAYDEQAGPTRRAKEADMSNHTYKLVEIVGSSPDGCDAAIRSAIAKAGETIKHIDWFEVVETRGHIEDGEVAHYQVTLKIGFRVT